MNRPFNTYLPSLLLVTIAWLLAPTAQADVVWKVSFKVILDENGNRPGTSTTQISDEDLQAQIDFANGNPYFKSRGFRLRLEEIVDLQGVSDWYNPPSDGNTTQKRRDLEAAAEDDPATYAWRTDAINIYVDDDRGGGSSFPGTGHDIILLGGVKIMFTPWTVLHEIGHYMGLYHTHTGQKYLDEDGAECEDGCSCAQLVPGDDGLEDTLPDHQCWDWDSIAANAFPLMHATDTMTDSAIERVNDVRYNIMSYHDQRDRLTPDQLDVMADVSVGSRNDVSINRVWFIDKEIILIGQNGSSVLPFSTVRRGLSAAGNGDVLVIRGGNYDETLILDTKLSLRASRGTAVIGR